MAGFPGQAGGQDDPAQTGRRGGRGGGAALHRGRPGLGRRQPDRRRGTPRPQPAKPLRQAQPLRPGRWGGEGGDQGPVAALPVTSLIHNAQGQLAETGPYRQALLHIDFYEKFA